jgi:hypothetical protein
MAGEDAGQAAGHGPANGLTRVASPARVPIGPGPARQRAGAHLGRNDFVDAYCLHGPSHRLLPSNGSHCDGADTARGVHCPLAESGPRY